MRISSVETLYYPLGDYERPYFNSIISFSKMRMAFVRVRTDEGAEGISLYTEGTSSFVEALGARIVGLDPLDSARCWHSMFTGWRKPVAKGDMIAAIGAVDNALWDLRGKLLDLPVYRLLGGFRPRVPVYAAGGYYAEGKGVKELVEEMAGYVDSGYRSVKMKVGGAPLAEDLDRIRAVREAVGPDVGIMIDANNAWNLTQALRFVKAAQEFDLVWFEEPCWPDDLEGMARLRQAVEVPIASGEIEFTRWGARDLVERGAVDIVQADPQTCGGLTEWVKIAAIASSHHLTMAPHGNVYVGAHAVAAVDNGLTVESYVELQPWQKRFIRPMCFEDGELVLPEEPGLGLEVDFGELERAALAAAR